MGGLLTGSPRGVESLRLLTGGGADFQSCKCIKHNLCFLSLFLTELSITFSFITYHFSFDNAIGLQMSSESSVTTIRSDCPVSATKFGEKIRHAHIHTHMHFCSSVFLFLLHMHFFCSCQLTFLLVKKKTFIVTLYFMWLSFIFIVNTCINCANGSKSQTYF